MVPVAAQRAATEALRVVCSNEFKGAHWPVEGKVHRPQIKTAVAEQHRVCAATVRASKQICKIKLAPIESFPAWLAWSRCGSSGWSVARIGSAVRVLVRRGWVPRRNILGVRGRWARRRTRLWIVLRRVRSAPARTTAARGRALRYAATIAAALPGRRNLAFRHTLVLSRSDAVNGSDSWINQGWLVSLGAVTRCVARCTELISITPSLAALGCLPRHPPSLELHLCVVHGVLRWVRWSANIRIWVCWHGRLASRRN